MMIFLTILVFILVFSLLILIHELGHFMAAKRAGVKVEEFGFGLPPRIFGVKKGETLYSLNWIPFGGFVRMLGEDGKGRRNKRSFASQPLRTQAWIVSAGVVMNFALAFVLLTIGFWIGIEPLMVDQEDFYDAVREGHVEMNLGESEEGMSMLMERLVYLESEDSLFADVLEAGDVIVSAQGRTVLNEEDLLARFEGEDTLSLEVYREGAGLVKVHDVPLPKQYPVISYVLEESPAEAIGLEVGDQILSVGGVEPSNGEAVVDLTQRMQVDSFLDYVILRDGRSIPYSIQLGEDGRVGVGLSDLIPYHGDLSLYPSHVPHNLVDIHEVSYGWEAPVVAVQEMWRLGRMTAVMFVGVLGEFLSGGEVPDGVAGPVGIAQMTFISLQDGFAATLRFVALLSLSLGVINILPIPALDGGRLLFIIYHGVTGRKPNARLEHWIHMTGFFLLIMFIIFVTFNDILNLF